MPPNHLIHEKSPYLIQHANNPVDWHPWSDKAFALAKAEDKPVFLSIGYATCHWCHVMEKESFEDEETARYLNDTFVCIKVDREERPDIDAVYMAACQMLTGSGGWPLSIFMTPDKKPFFAATYLPKRSRYGRAGLIDICRQVRELWSTQQEKIESSAQSIYASLSRAFAFTAADPPEASLLEQAFGQMRTRFDAQYGGFGQAPKFPTPHGLLFLLRYHHSNRESSAWSMVEKTLIHMRMGGIWDHVGYGFHRYSTDERWLLPHFEKMLYDQALLAAAYLEAYQISRAPLFAETAEEIFTYVLRDMTSAQGGFYSAEDADSEGEEGKFYVWTTEEFRQVAGPEAGRRWEAILRLSTEGNFVEEATGRKTGANILHLTAPLTNWAEKLGLPPDQLGDEWNTLREKLFHTREQRIHPLKDDKILTDWNGLMIAALALGARVLNKPEYERAARKAAQFILSNMRDETGRLYHRFREGDLIVDAHAADYAFLILGLLGLYRTTLDLTFADAALELQKTMIEEFWDEQDGGFFSTPEGRADLPVRPKELYDGAIPSANSVALFNMVSLFRLTGDPAWEDRSKAQIQAFAGTVTSQPEAFTYFLSALGFAIGPDQEVIISGDPQRPDTQALLTALNRDFAPNRVVIFKSEQNAPRLTKFAPYTEGLPVTEGKATAHVCRNGACSLSTDDTETLLGQLLDI
ncbi:MAG: thioredoxin domain-containing protein [Deltaproteobacteria bacterium]|nr:thioredoxin domain-containing protein [Deltaproteobacteria bacterium]